MFILAPDFSFYTKCGYEHSHKSLCGCKHSFLLDNIYQNEIARSYDEFMLDYEGNRRTFFSEVAAPIHIRTNVMGRF